jgi:hypothetical protein
MTVMLVVAVVWFIGILFVCFFFHGSTKADRG